MAELTGWDLVLDIVRRKCDDASLAAREATLNLEVAKAVTEVYRRLGQRHPSTYGASSSVEDFQERLAVESAALSRWEEAFRLVEHASSLDAAIPEQPATRPAREFF